ncbi:O-antigen ligase family protein [Halalkalicoccus subterraneus]|uniref:O-antigen ligase family protein n=1 Tax=Halalkalicoccus subterraneus TaxID=2675002 RepID=UPI001FE63504|nr:O-antigen ligase family protein [Halalkalicoccus subterraneus]
MDRLTDLLFAATFLLAVLASTTEQFRSVHLVLMYLFLVAIAFNQYDARRHGGISPLFSLQVALTFALGTVLLVLVVGGLGFRRIELLAVLFLLFVFTLVRDDLGRFLPVAAPYLGVAVVVTGIFFSHAQEFGSATGLGLFPVFAGILLAFNCFVLPRYVSADAVYWTVAGVAAGATLLALPAIVYGDFSLWIFEIRTWSATVSFGGFGEVPVLRSVFANPNTFGLLAFAGVFASAVAFHRTISRSDYPLLAAAPLGWLAITAAGLYLSNSRASMLAAAVAVVVYALVATDRRLLPIAVVGIAVSVPVFLVLIYHSVLPIDPANRFTLWQAGIEATRYDSGLFGQGIIGTGTAIEPYTDVGGSVHNSYLSIFIRTGLIGGLAYCLLVLGPLVHGTLDYRRVDAGMFALATGFAIHQFFEGYTLFQLGHGSILAALAVGYVITSLAGEIRSTPSDADSAVGRSEGLSSLGFEYGTEARYGTEHRNDRP